MACKQTKSEYVEDYFNRLLGLYDELNRLKPLYSCSCGLCTCGLAAKLATDRDEERLHQLLVGIDDDLYVTVRTNLLSDLKVLLQILTVRTKLFFKNRNLVLLLAGKPYLMMFILLLCVRSPVNMTNWTNQLLPARIVNVAGMTVIYYIYLFLN